MRYNIKRTPRIDYFPKTEDSIETIEDIKINEYVESDENIQMYKELEDGLKLKLEETLKEAIKLKKAQLERMEYNSN